MSTTELRRSAGTASERLDRMRADLPQVQVNAAKTYLADESAPVTIATMELIVPGLFNLARAAEGRDLLLLAARTRAQLESLPTPLKGTLSYEEDRRKWQLASTSLENVVARLHEWQTANSEYVSASHTLAQEYATNE